MSEVLAMTAAMEGASLEEVSARHRKERKELQAKIQAMKKNAPKSDKKKRKEAMEEVARMEVDMDQRHTAELTAVEQRASNDVAEAADTCRTAKAATNAASDDGADEDDPNPQQRVSKAQKRRNKKEREAREREEEIKIAAEEAQFASKAVEMLQMQRKLEERQLAPHQIASDGDCMYNAVKHQLVEHGLGAYTVKQLRCETANYIAANKDALICYMTHPTTGNLLTDEEFVKYCEDVRSTPAWGSEIELKALSSVLKVPIEVLQAEGPPTVHGADTFAGPNLIITYHRHMYSLGEHYNSTIPLSEGSKAGASDDNWT